MKASLLKKVLLFRVKQLFSAPAWGLRVTMEPHLTGYCKRTCSQQFLDLQWY